VLPQLETIVLTQLKDRRTSNVSALVGFCRAALGRFKHEVCDTLCTHSITYLLQL
jgi:hypothetical protein